MKIENQKSKISNLRSGFTLLELLVAITILLIIVMMMSGIFFQSRVAWGSGLRRSRVVMQGRAAADLISSDLSQAIADEKLPFDIGSAHVEFYMLDETGRDNRGVKKVRYARSGDAVTREEWIVRLDDNTAYPQAEESTAGGGRDLVRNVSRFRLSADPDFSGSTNLPRWVDIELEIGETEDVSNVRAGSRGRDHEWGTDRDIWSDES